MPNTDNSQGHVSRVLVAALIGVVAVPTAMTGLFQSIDDDGTNAVPVIDMRYRALGDAARVRQLRRDYWKAVDIYNELNRLGIDNPGPPDINYRELINYYLDPMNFIGTAAEGAVHASAPEEEVVAVLSDAQREYSELPEMYRDLMDGYMLTGRCPGTLRQFHLAGFYDLCRRLLPERKEALAPRLNFLSKSLDGFHSVGYAPLRNLRNRLENLEQSLLFEGGTSIRPKTYEGTRRPRQYRTDQ